MVDPLTIIGAAASVASIVELVGKTVSALNTLHSRWKEADFTFINLIAQLTALRAALSKIQEWMDTNMDEPHHQLAMDLEASVNCCRMLVRRLDSEVEDLQQNSETGIDAQNKIKLVLKNGTLEELQKMVDRQTSALTLLLTVCNCKAISEQKIMLEKTSTRKIFKRVKDDTSSLRCTDSLSKISKMFEFDRELFISKVYEKALRGSLKDTVENMRREAEQPYVIATPEERTTNKLIEHELKEHARKMRRECKVLLLGDQDCAQTLIKSMKIAHSGGFTYEEREEYQVVVMNYIIRVMKGLAYILKNGDIDLDDTAKMHAKVLSQEIEKIQAGDGKITIEGAGAVQDYEVFIPDSSLYFIEEIQRIAQNDYLPTDTDILKLGIATPTKAGAQEHRFTMGRLSLHMFDISSQRSVKMKWIHQFETSISIVFCVDLSQYDHVLLQESNPNRLIESLSLFDSVVNSPWFLRTSITLLLCNVGHFEEKLRSKPLSNYFPDYNGGNDVRRASKYLVKKFEQVNRAHLRLCARVCEISDDSSMRFVWWMVQETLHHNDLRNASII
ncbi:Uncharacterized protein BP5553_02521 [Venustampulla echinocandica]|uniref:P-loop containing nucleoside triphosphate hydrolase n=1 Tax=Venustampulla echinocandica TaxID=2656787 RepID=A0A370U442_9HELO|nr:Uncharacterized protein BP5553_02521 [Venustampulla echinocandica]RDL42542.1 Uncharacterized protein BP5553_02521 [Venustampulla echinocandica]